MPKNSRKDEVDSVNHKRQRISGEPILLNHRKNKSGSDDMIDLTNNGIVETIFGYNIFNNNNDIDNDNDDMKKNKNNVKRYSFPNPNPIVVKGNENILTILKEQLYDLDIDMMLENTASENIHVWLKDIDKIKDNSLDSITVDSASHAKSLYNAGHSLYCRASQELESEVIPKVLEELGIGINTSKSDRFRRGEIETFFSRKGHLTDFHVDFQENFTIQLTGKKRWTFCNSSIVAPIRGCTPHYSGVGQDKSVAEQQLKVLKLGNTDFDPQEYKSSDVWSVVLEAGDTMYHPAGIWHKVECIEDSISINISMIGASYAEVVCCGLQQLLWERRQYRQPVNTMNLANTHDVMKNIFSDIPCILEKLKPSDFLLSFAGDDEDEVPEADNDNDNDDDDDDDEDDGDVDGESEDNSSIPDIDKVINLHVGIILEELTSSSEIRINPLAQILSEKDLQSLGWSNNSYQKQDGDEIFVVHSGFGNEYLESLSQKSLVVPSQLTFAIPALYRFMKVVKDSLFPSKILFPNTIDNTPNHHIYNAMKNNSITVAEFMAIGNDATKNKKNDKKKDYEKNILIFLSGFIKAGLIVLE